jgi:hypothetical protein
MMRNVPTRRVAAVAAITALAPVGVAIATSPPDTAPPTTGEAQQADTTMSTTMTAAESVPATETPGATTEPAEAAAAEVTVFDENGNPEATIMVLDAVMDWSDYAEDDAPDDGQEYTRIEVSVQNVRAEEDFEVNIDHFVLQNIYGILTTAQNTPTAQQVADAAEELEEEAGALDTGIGVLDTGVGVLDDDADVPAGDVDIPDGAELGPGESVDLALTFAVDRGVEPDSLFFRPNDDQMVDVAELRPTDAATGSATTTPDETTGSATTTPDDTTGSATTTPDTEVNDVTTSEVTQTSIVTQESVVTTQPG